MIRTYAWLTHRYRAPELLFGAMEYGPASDCWSCGCVIAELWLLRPLFRGKLDGEHGESSSSSSSSSDSSELDQLGKIFMHCGTPTEENWPGVSELHRFVEFQPCAPAPRLLPPGTSAGDDPEAARMVKGLLTLDPQQVFSELVDGALFFYLSFISNSSLVPLFIAVYPQSKIFECIYACVRVSCLFTAPFGCRMPCFAVLLELTSADAASSTSTIRELFVNFYVFLHLHIFPVGSVSWKVLEKPI